MKTGLEIKEMTLNALHPKLLQHFNRYQKVQRCFRFENGKWVLKDTPFIEQWDEELKEEIVAMDFTNCLKSGGILWGAFNHKNELIAFANIGSHFFGSEHQYLQLMQLHVSYEYRGMGLGKELFQLCVQKAKQLGAKKLYISAHAAEESQHFYESLDCVDAVEVNAEIAAYEPYDRQMEFVIEIFER